MAYIRSVTAGPFETNAYLFGPDGESETVLIDAPPESYKAIMDIAAADGRSLAALLITHPHLDHIFDAPRFAADGVPIFALADAVPGLEKPNASGIVPMPPGGISGTRTDRVIRAGEVLSLAGLEFEVMEVPGHSPGSAAFLVSRENLCFVGDLIFRGSVGRTDLEGGDFDLLAESVRTRIYPLSDDIILYPGHGPATDVGEERRSNPYVRG